MNMWNLAEVARIRIAEAEEQAAARRSTSDVSTPVSTFASRRAARRLRTDA